jgi:hypothetical protein
MLYMETASHVPSLIAILSCVGVLSFVALYEVKWLVIVKYCVQQTFQLFWLKMKFDLKIRQNHKYILIPEQAE